MNSDMTRVIRDEGRAAHARIRRAEQEKREDHGLILLMDLENICSLRVFDDQELVELLRLKCNEVCWDNVSLEHVEAPF